MNLQSLIILVAPPILGGIIGYFTNDIAIKMLFRPYKPIHLGGRRLPFTPGLIPANQERLAQRISNAILGSLLTPEELQNIARRLLQPERVQAAIQWLLSLTLTQIQQGNEQRTVKIVSNILHDLVGQSLPRTIKVLARREDFLEAQLNQLFDQVLLEFQFSQSQAEQLSKWMLDAVLPPDVLRQGAIDFLTDRNIQVIDESFRSKTSGTYWVVANLFGVRNALVRLRTHCLDEPDASNAVIKELIRTLNIQDRLREVLQNLSLQNLPVSTVRQLRRTLRDNFRHYLQTQGEELLMGLSNSVDWDKVAGLLVNRLRASEAVNSSLEPVSKELALVLERYLERDLEAIVKQAIPILNLEQVIMDRVKATSPQNLEAAIQGIVKSELQGIVNLGGILGVVVGLMQTVFVLLTR
ncbi:DUF445 domain-containing protein [Thermoleptolyngbya sichuanensis A183]|uniref:DUF445 domain-containing protein n=1 Tax=Thermoleptolyngbya sichuanensis A183 TaxID=2737172 RepID=A0A6M8BAL3_9CYAN|nr:MULTISPECIES: DUF445 family protein [Thermoleptolyngbya]QKD84114.1 DUF445 domain-containing protein [Thermoleptolyngbya sichuanensis A183]